MLKRAFGGFAKGKIQNYNPAQALVILRGGPMEWVSVRLKADARLTQSATTISLGDVSFAYSKEMSQIPRAINAVSCVAERRQSAALSTKKYRASRDVRPLCGLKGSRPSAAKELRFAQQPLPFGGEKVSPFGDKRYALLRDENRGVFR